MQSHAKVVHASDRFSYNLHIMRGLAALIVLAYHAFSILQVGGVAEPHAVALQLGQGFQPWQLAFVLFNGPACVTLFFVLSGAVLAMSMSREPIESVTGLGAYYIKRGFRLYPLLIAAAILAAVLIVAAPVAPTPDTTPWFANQRIVEPDDIPKQLIINALGASSSLNSAAWSIKVEILGSLLLPGLMLIARRQTTTLIALVALTALMLLPHEPRQTAYMRDFTLAFLCGVVLVERGGAVIARLAVSPALARRAALAVGLVFLVLSRRLLGPDTFVPPLAVICETAASTLIVLALLASPERSGVVRTIGKPLGDLSFGIYLLHIPVMVVLTPMLLRVSEGAPWAVRCLLIAAGALVVTAPLAQLLFRVVEKPFVTFGKHATKLLGLAPRRAPINVAAE